MLLGKGQWGVSPKHEVVRMALRVELSTSDPEGRGVRSWILCVCVCVSQACSPVELVS